jgi:hypothetical protein
MTAFNKAWGVVKEGDDDDPTGKRIPSTDIMPWEEQQELIFRMALGMAHQQILSGGERATKEIWDDSDFTNSGSVKLAIDNVAGQFGINPMALQQRYDAHEFADPGWRDDYHDALARFQQLGRRMQGG